jgi:hypothetical protein
MARINLDDDLYKDKRFQWLLIKTGHPTIAQGAIMEAFKLAQKYFDNPHTKGLIPWEEWEQQDMHPALLESKCAIKQEDGVYVMGSKTKFTWLKGKSEGGRTVTPKKLESLEKARKIKKTKNAATENSLYSSIQTTDATEISIQPTENSIQVSENSEVTRDEYADDSLDSLNEQKDAQASRISLFKRSVNTEFFLYSSIQATENSEASIALLPSLSQLKEKEKEEGNLSEDSGDPGVYPEIHAAKSDLHISSRPRPSPDRPSFTLEVS